MIKPDEEVNHVSMDSSGIQTYTGNKWLENKHEKNDKGLIVANSTTEHNVDDRSQVDELITGINPKEFLAEARYDEEYMYQLLRSKGMKPTIRLPNRPPETKMGHLKTERDIEVEYQQNKGYQAWRVKNEYGRREMSENTFFRFKNSFSNRFLSRGIENMKRYFRKFLFYGKIIPRFIQSGGRSFIP